MSAGTSMSVPTDSDGFFRRECPGCEEQFKVPAVAHDDWLTVDVWHCPLCGVAAGEDQWLTREQVEHAEALMVPLALQEVSRGLEEAFRGVKGMTYSGGSGGFGTPVPEPLYEPDDMVIVGAPCHETFAVKVPIERLGAVHCLACGSAFRA